MTPRVIPTSSAEWNAAEAKFLEYCKKHATSPEDYSEKFRRDKSWVIESIINGTFDESFFFRTRKERHIDCLQKFDDWLRSHGINPDTYESNFGHQKWSALRVLDVGGELDEGYWLKKGVTKDEVDEFLSEQLESRGLSLKDYSIKTRRSLGDLRKLVRRNYSLALEDPAYLDELCSPNLDMARSPEMILAQAKRRIPPGRTAGVGVLELGAKLKGLVKTYYPGGLDQLNKDLGLAANFHIPDFKLVQDSSPTKNEIRIDEINKKIDRICQHLDPAKLQLLRNQLTSLSLQEDELQGVAHDDKILDALRSEVFGSLRVSAGYLYLKKWSIDDHTWFKIGVTNSPNRRDSEQNVLPVPAETLYLVRMDTMDHARAAEKAFHKVLESRRIRGAKNKELFKLSGPDYKSVMIVFGELVDYFSQPDDC